MEIAKNKKENKNVTLVTDKIELDKLIKIVYPIFKIFCNNALTSSF